MKVKLRTASFLSKVIEEKSFSTFIKIIKDMRGPYSAVTYSKWTKIKIKNLFLPNMSLNEKRAILIFAAFCSNGYLREKAVKELLHYPNTLKYILISRNDKVLEVRNTAKIILEHKYKNLVNKELINAICAIKKLVKYNPDNFNNDYALFVCHLLDNTDELNEGLKSNESKIRVFCASLILKQDSKLDILVKPYLTKEKNAYNRKAVYDDYLKSDLISNDILEMMLNDSYAKVRIRALNYMYTNKLNDYTIAFDHLLDVNSNVRFFARYIIKQHEVTFSFRDFYLNELRKNNIIAILGLGETGIKEDTVVLEKYLKDKSGKTVRMAINALIYLDEQKYIKSFVSFLNDTRDVIVKNIVKILSKEAELHEEAIKEIFNSSKNSFVRLKCMKLLFSVSKWKALNNIILALDDDDIAISDFAKSSLETWIEKFNKSFILPSTEERKVILHNILKTKRKDTPLKQLLYYIN